jgi:hypothetical protein
MNNEDKPIDVFSLFGGATKPQHTKEMPKEIKPIHDKNLEDIQREWLSVDNDALFTEAF